MGWLKDFLNKLHTSSPRSGAPFHMKGYGPFSIEKGRFKTPEGISGKPEAGRFTVKKGAYTAPGIAGYPGDENKAHYRRVAERGNALLAKERAGIEENKAYYNRLREASKPILAKELANALGGNEKRKSAIPASTAGGMSLVDPFAGVKERTRTQGSGPRPPYDKIGGVRPGTKKAMNAPASKAGGMSLAGTSLDYSFEGIDEKTRKKAGEGTLVNPESPKDVPKTKEKNEKTIADAAKRYTSPKGKPLDPNLPAEEAYRKLMGKGDDVIKAYLERHGKMPIEEIRGTPLPPMPYGHYAPTAAGGGLNAQRTVSSTSGGSRSKYHGPDKGRFTQAGRIGTTGSTTVTTRSMPQQLPANPRSGMAFVNYLNQNPIQRTYTNPESMKRYGSMLEAGLGIGKELPLANYANQQALDAAIAKIAEENKGRVDAAKARGGDVQDLEALLLGAGADEAQEQAIPKFDGNEAKLQGYYDTIESLGGNTPEAKEFVRELWKKDPGAVLEMQKRG